MKGVDSDSEKKREREKRKVGERYQKEIMMMMMITFIQRCSPLLSRLTALACDST